MTKSLALACSALALCAGLSFASVAQADDAMSAGSGDAMMKKDSMKKHDTMMKKHDGMMKKHAMKGDAMKKDSMSKDATSDE
ncbi:pentapeptide MXKDX repeat protein [Lichenifustis flavocetrariae]|uniref:Pentapeptide MXKDX repeat protein n=1 Tax=Lichenifustis flavocetrariae TaxID=2949735 RepID=A0AA41YTC0_9HYPH|nr:pentapeptide MXKDX repeat protein [Lichenifustis flavocetrariae]MCW6506652.1 pentapeptide MXKDX repeat protein [Lichenifustis flavocetrariae]